MWLVAFQLFTLICIQRLTGISATGNETIETLVDESISNLQKIKLKYQSLAIIKKLYGACLPCRPIPESKHCDCTAAKPMQDCLEFRQAGYKNDGIYRLSGPGFNRPNVFCDQTTQGGGWTTLLSRHDGSLDFQKNWNEYKHGFGKLTNEFWLGNEIVHDLTKSSIAPKKSELLINMKLVGKAGSVYAKYAVFEVGDEASKYILKISGASGTAPKLTGSDTFLGNHNNMKFSTFDSDNDKLFAPHHCSKSSGRVGWWFNRCYVTLLTGSWGSRSFWNEPSKTKFNFVEVKFRRKL